MLQKPMPTVPKIDVFKGLNKWQIEELWSWLQRRDYSKGKVIFKEAQLPDGMYVLTNGSVSVMKVSQKGQFKLADLTAPDFFGEMALLNGRERSAEIRAKTDVTCGLLAADLFNAKLLAHNLTAHLIALNIGRLLCQRLRTANTKMASMTALMAQRRPISPN